MMSDEYLLKKDYEGNRTIAEIEQWFDFLLRFTESCVKMAIEQMFFAKKYYMQGDHSNEDGVSS